MDERQNQEITLEKIDLIRARMNVGYREAREALEQSQGDLVLALIQMEEQLNQEETIHESQADYWKEEIVTKGSELIEKVKALIAEGNATRIRIRQGDRTILEIPIFFGTAGVILLPQLAAVGAIAALFSSVTIEVHRQGKPGKKLFDSEKSEVEDVVDLAEDVWPEVQEAGEEILEEIEEVVEDIVEPEEEPEI